MHVFMHSPVFGSLLPSKADNSDEAISQPQMEMTSNVVAHSLVYWTQDLVRRGMLGAGSRIFSMTSEGSQRVLPHYGAVSAAKAALESHTRQLALELGSCGILVNCINAGVTDTPALRAILDNEIMITETLRRSPQHRLTTTDDVAATIVALSQPEIKFISGSVVFVDGGESILP